MQHRWLHSGRSSHRTSDAQTHQHLALAHFVKPKGLKIILACVLDSSTYTLLAQVFHVLVVVILELFCVSVGQAKIVMRDPPYVLLAAICPCLSPQFPITICDREANQVLPPEQDS